MTHQRPRELSKPHLSGEANGQYKHGQIRSKEYKAWLNMLQRCSNPKTKAYKSYGGRGISVCERWRTFKHFLADMGKAPTKDHSLDRIDVDGPYEPSNCKWSTREEQVSNRQSSRYVNGSRKTLAELALEYGVPFSTLQTRLYRHGMTVEQALNVPYRYRLKSRKDKIEFRYKELSDKYNACLAECEKLAGAIENHLGCGGDGNDSLIEALELYRKFKGEEK